MAVKLKDIAERAGVSLQTVGHILGKRGHLFRAETRERVQEVARELGYRRNTAAKTMRTGKFDCVAMLQSAGRGPREELVRGVQSVLNTRGIRLLTADLPDEKVTAKGFVPHILNELCADGILISYDTLIPEMMLKLIDEHHIPAVWINSDQSANCVTFDYQEGGALAVRELIRKGHRHIGWLNYTVSPHYSCEALMEGCRKAVKEAGGPVKLVEHCIRLPRVERIQNARQWLEENPALTAVVNNASSSAYPLMLVAREMGRKIPDDLSIVTTGYAPQDETGILMASIHLDAVQMGRQAAQMLLARMDDPDPDHPAEMVAPVLDPGHTLVAPGRD